LGVSEVDLPEDLELVGACAHIEEGVSLLLVVVAHRLVVELEDLDDWLSDMLGEYLSMPLVLAFPEAIYLKLLVWQIEFHRGFLGFF